MVDILTNNVPLENKRFSRRITMKIIVPGELTDLNTYIAADRMHRFKGGKVKKDNTDKVRYCIKGLRNKKKFTKPVYLIYTWYCKDKMKDKDNIAFAKKFIQDALVLEGIIPNDGWNNIEGYADNFFIDKQNPRIEIEIE